MERRLRYRHIKEIRNLNKLCTNKSINIGGVPTTIESEKKGFAGENPKDIRISNTEKK